MNSIHYINSVLIIPTNLDCMSDLLSDLVTLSREHWIISILLIGCSPLTAD